MLVSQQELEHRIRRSGHVLKIVRGVVPAAGNVNMGGIKGRVIDPVSVVYVAGILQVGIVAATLLPHVLQQEIRRAVRSEEHTSELQSLMRISYAVFCLKKKTQQETH